MTAVADNDSFFDSDGEPDDPRANSPYLKGAYDRGDASPIAEADPQRATKNKSLTPSTSGNFSAKSSDSIMSEKREARSRRYDDDSPPRSPSPSPYRSSPAYSDSFDSEDSDQDSRRASPERVRRAPSGKPKGKARGGYSSTTSTNRFNSGTSQDSRSTNKSYGGSANYGNNSRTNKKGFQKTPLKKTPAANNKANTTKQRSNSTASSQASPRNTNEVTRRMLSAKGHTISRLRNEFNQVQKDHDDLARENKLLKTLQRRHERALARFDSEESELPQLLKKHSAELDSMRRRIRKYQERDKDKDRRMKDKDDQFLRAEDELKKIKGLAEDKGLLERHELQRRLGRLEDRLAERGKKVEELEGYVRHMKKNQRRELRDKQGKEEDLRGTVQNLEMENERLQLQLREKEKELDVRNIYSNRLIKPPGKLRANLSPTALKPIMLSKSTSTVADKLPKLPRPPPPEQQPRECSSAEENRRRQETAARVKSPKDVSTAAAKEAPKETTTTAEPEPEPVKQQEELSEHEKILRDLDMGWEKRGGGGVGEGADARKRQEDERQERLEGERKKREEEERRQRELDEMQRREEEDRRRRREAEEAAAEAKRKQEAEEKPSVYKRPSFFGSKPDAPSDQYKPSFLDPSPAVQSKPSIAKREDNSNGYKPSFFQSPAKPNPTQHPQPTFANSTQKSPGPEPVSLGATNSNPASKFSDEDDVDFFKTQPPASNAPAWLRDKSDGTKEKEEKKKKALRRALLSDSDEDEEENVPFFGSKPTEAPEPAAVQSPVYAVNSVRDLQKYSRGDSSNTPKQEQTGQSTSGGLGQNQAADANGADQQTDAEERRKKDLLLARMREIDDGVKPDSGKSRKNYNFSRPVENLHNGVPSHPDDSAGGKGKKDDSLTFGGYAPTFSSGTAQPKPKKKSFFSDDDDDDADNGGDVFAKPKPAAKQDPASKKSDLMADLFGGNNNNTAAGEEKAAKSSFNDDKNMFTSSTKAKPVSYPWEKKVDVGQGDNDLKPPSASKAPGNMSHDSLDDIDDLEEVIL